MRKQDMMALGIACLVGALSNGCATDDAGASAQLRPGMTYREVGQALAKADPDIQEDIREALQQEAEARKDYRRTVQEMRDMGLASAPPMRSQVTLNRGDYVLHFRDGQLVSWAAR
jgi:hypothetical protein